jgi:hypothetical protein
MRRYYPVLLLLFCQSFVLKSWGQKKLALEQIQVFSTINPNASYWNLPKDIQPILNALDSGIFLKLGLNRDLNIVPTTLKLAKQTQLGKININWTATRDYDYHAYLELYEMDPDFIYKNNLVEVSDSKKDSIHSFWFITVSLFNNQQQKTLQRTIILGLAPVASLGIGYVNQTSASTPYHIYNAVTQSIRLLSPEGEGIEYLDAKLPTAYTTDNYWMPYVHNQPRIIFDTTKSFITYNTKTGAHILRSPTAILNKINIKDKNPDNPYKNIIGLIKKNRINAYNSEYYQVLQHLRDVKNDHDYDIEGYMEFNAEAAAANFQLALVFLPDSVHKIYNNKDSIGHFIVKDIVTEKDKYFYTEMIYNGYDSTKQYAITDKIISPKYPIVHVKSIDGKINNAHFSIKLSANNTIKTIFINDKLSMILSGKEKPYQMVLVDKNADEQLSDFLIMFSFSEIFKNPN